MNELQFEYFIDQLNKLEELNGKINSCRSIITICAERLTTDESGALWAASDILIDIEEKIDERIYNLSDIYQTFKKISKKGKK